MIAALAACGGTSSSPRVDVPDGEAPTDSPSVSVPDISAEDISPDLAAIEDGYGAPDVPEDVAPDPDVEDLPLQTRRVRIDGGSGLADQVHRVLAASGGGYLAVLDVMRSQRRVAVVRFDAVDASIWSHVRDEPFDQDQVALDGAVTATRIAVLYRSGEDSRLRGLTPGGDEVFDVAGGAIAAPLAGATHLGATSDGRIIAMATARMGVPATAVFVGDDGASLGEVPLVLAARESSAVRIERDRLAFSGDGRIGLQTLDGMLVWEAAGGVGVTGPEVLAIAPDASVTAADLTYYGDGEWPPDPATIVARTWDADGSVTVDGVLDSVDSEPQVGFGFRETGERYTVSSGSRGQPISFGHGGGSDGHPGWSYSGLHERLASLAFLADGSLVIAGSIGLEQPTDPGDGLVIHVPDPSAPAVDGPTSRVTLGAGPPPAGACEGPRSCSADAGDCVTLCEIELVLEPSPPAAQDALILSTDADSGATTWRLEPESTPLAGWYYGTTRIGGVGSTPVRVASDWEEGVVAFDGEGVPAERRCSLRSPVNEIVPAGDHFVRSAWFDTETGWRYGLSLSLDPLVGVPSPVGVDGNRVLTLEGDILVLMDFSDGTGVVVTSRVWPGPEAAGLSAPISLDGLALGLWGFAVDMRSPALDIHALGSTAAACAFDLTPVPGEPGTVVPIRLGTSPPQRVAGGDAFACDSRADPNSPAFAADPGAPRFALGRAGSLWFARPDGTFAISAVYNSVGRALTWVGGALVVEAGWTPTSFVWLDPATAAPTEGAPAPVQVLARITDRGTDGVALWAVGALGTDPPLVWRITQLAAEPVATPGLSAPLELAVRRGAPAGAPAAFLSDPHGAVRAYSTEGALVAEASLDSPLVGPTAAGAAGLFGRNHLGQVVWLSPDLSVLRHTAGCERFVPTAVVGMSSGVPRLVGVEGPAGGASGAGLSMVVVADVADSDGVLTLTSVLRHPTEGLPVVEIDADDGALWFTRADPATALPAWNRLMLPL